MNEHGLQDLLFEMNDDAATGPVTCLGLTFASDEARRAHFTEELRKKLPELKKLEGYPVGDDERILALSDPPFYTCCPNPWFMEMMEEWEKNRPAGLAPRSYKPFASDVAEGKNDAIYNAHSYHTKVPYKAIMRYILNYTEPGDIIFDGFCGTGMTGVAAQLCRSREVVEELGYKVDDAGDIHMYNDNKEWEPFSRIGERKTLLMDLSPAATMISYNYNKRTDARQLEANLQDQLQRFQDEHQWMYATLSEGQSPDAADAMAEELKAAARSNGFKDFYRKNSGRFGTVNYIVWSDIYICPECMTEHAYWEIGWDDENKMLKESFTCHQCGSNYPDKNAMTRAWTTEFDSLLGAEIKQPKQVPVLINYSVNKKRFQKTPDKLDLFIIQTARELMEKAGYAYPVEALPTGVKMSEPLRYGVTHVHHFYSRRSLLLLGAFQEEADIRTFEKQFVFGSILPKVNRMNRFMPQHGSRALVGPMANALYFPPLHVENNIIDQLFFQAGKIVKALRQHGGNAISTQSATRTSIPDESVDYIFIDPPFGANIMYSELNFVRESWLGLKTNNASEAIENKSQNKDIEEYKRLMTLCLKESYRILKPGKWITVEFSNTQAKVWNAIQQSITEAGYIIASVYALDKKRGGFHAMITSTAVKQDLVISAYKPNRGNLDETAIVSGSDLLWTFVEEHLERLPVYLGADGYTEIVVERTPRILYDRMVAYFVQKGWLIPLSSVEFQEQLENRYLVRDGMIFLEKQMAEYDKRRLRAKDMVQMSIFVNDENSAIEWLRQQLLKKPQTRQDLHPNYMKEIQHISKHEQLPELDALLEQNFLKYDGTEEVPSQIHTYLSSDYKDLRNLPKHDHALKAKAKERWYVPDPNKRADLEKLREKSLLREFETYREELDGSRKKLKQFRTEAIRAGFKKAWGDKDYQLIAMIGERLPENVLQEDEKLLMYFDNAQIRLGR
ncbi:DNA methyltransferase [Paenibacillus contaminans]|uniref:DNA methylase n=1 Tax=Paenibacillus contaminans TaxID=450362 RepID=A0A329MIP4_9BACL|nr:DNA methyltransferase [Paenibacillus contaminans]RAV19674.1 DNA methylase [Paenibacillus contaminans]